MFSSKEEFNIVIDTLIDMGFLVVNIEGIQLDYAKLDEIRAFLASEEVV